MAAVPLRFRWLVMMLPLTGASVQAATTDTITWVSPPYYLGSLSCNVTPSLLTCEYDDLRAGGTAQANPPLFQSFTAVAIQTRNTSTGLPNEVCAKTSTATYCWSFSYNSVAFELSLVSMGSQADADKDVFRDAKDNCPTVSNPTQLNSDSTADGGDACDADDDNDTVADGSDNCPLVSNLDQLNTDGDAQGNVCDSDDDNDSHADTLDLYPLNANKWRADVRHDIDIDRDSDILVRSASTGAWTSYGIQNNVVIDAAAMNAPTSSDLAYVAQLDANGDGDADILTRNTTTGAWTLSIVESGAVTSSVGLALYANLGYVFVGTGDFNNDGTDDVLLRDATSGYRIFLLQNHAVASNAFYNAWISADSVDQGIGDFDGDGTDDLLVRKTSDSQYYIFKTVNGAVVSHACACNIWKNPDWTFQFAGDMNKNGIDDIIIRGTGATGDGKWWVFKMANFYSQGYNNLNLFYNKTAVSLGGWGDYNGDGTIDVLTRVNNATTYVSPINNAVVVSNTKLADFTVDQVIGK